MSRVSFEVPPEQKAMLSDQARSLGVSLACYARNLVLDGSKRSSRGDQAELLRTIRALVPTMAAIYGNNRNLTPEQVQEWRQIILAIFEKERSKP